MQQRRLARARRADHRHLLAGAMVRQRRSAAGRRPRRRVARKRLERRSAFGGIA
jgi:hypothetical protein